MSPTSTDPSGEDLKKVYSRHYHKAADATTIIDSRSRREIDFLRRRNRSRLMKLCAIGFSLLSLALAAMLYLSKLP